MLHRLDFLDISKGNLPAERQGGHKPVHLINLQQAQFLLGGLEKITKIIGFFINRQKKFCTSLSIPPKLRSTSSPV